MEAQSFDDLAKSLAHPVSRLQVLKVLMGAAAAGVFPGGMKLGGKGTPVDPVTSSGGKYCDKYPDKYAAKRGCVGSTSSSAPPTRINASPCVTFCNQQFGGGTAGAEQCINQSLAGQGLCYSPCGPIGGGSGELCGAGVCCAGGSATPNCCFGTCTSLQTDTNNCGSCGTSCNGTSVGLCVNGTCACFGLLHACTSPTDCCNTGPGVGVTTCQNNLCCNQAGGMCTDDPDCCGSLHCTLGFCA